VANTLVNIVVGLAPMHKAQDLVAGQLHSQILQLSAGTHLESVPSYHAVREDVCCLESKHGFYGSITFSSLPMG
jgi:hypothetical protein